MSPRTAHSKTHRFIEVLALLTLVVPLFSPIPAPSWLPFAPQVAVPVLAALLVLLSLVHRPVRHAGWVAILVAGLAALVLRPDSVEGTLLVLFGAFLVFDSGWPGRLTVPAAGILGGLVVVAQVGSCLLRPEALLLLLARWVVIDGLLAVLVVTFRRDLFLQGEDHRPVLVLEAFGLTCQEGQILQLFWAGLSSKEIAAELRKSDNAVRIVLSKIYTKMGVANGKELATLVHSHQIVFGESGELEPEGRGKVKL